MRPQANWDNLRPQVRSKGGKRRRLLDNLAGTARGSGPQNHECLSLPASRTEPEMSYFHWIPPSPDPIHLYNDVALLLRGKMHADARELKEDVLEPSTDSSIRVL